MQVTVKDLMTFPVARIDRRATVRQTMELILQEGVNEVYVCDENERLLGIVTDYELLKTDLIGGCREDAVEPLMNQDVPVFSLSTTAGQAAAVLRDGRYRHIAVVDEGRVVGRVSRIDVLRSRMDFEDVSTREDRTLGPATAVSPGALRGVTTVKAGDSSQRMRANHPHIAMKDVRPRFLTQQGGKIKEAVSPADQA